MNELTKNYVKELRQNSTDAEKHLWYYLRARRLKGYKIRRQHLIYPYVVDFVCLERKLIIELDGGQHDNQHSYDEKRTAFLQTKEYLVLRFWNHEALQETDTVLNEILAALKRKI